MTQSLPETAAETVKFFMQFLLADSAESECDIPHPE